MFRGAAGLRRLGVRSAAAAIVFVALSAVLTRAQVLQIDETGAVTVFDRPAVFTDAGVAPIGQRSQAPLVADPSAIGIAANAARLSPALVEAVAWRESRMTPGAVSPAGAVGEMQLMPATARALGVDPWDSRQNYLGGAAYLRALLDHYHGDLVLTLAAYNAGPAAVSRFGGVPPYRETQAYVAGVLQSLGDRSAITRSLR